MQFGSHYIMLQLNQAENLSEVIENFELSLGAMINILPILMCCVL